MMIRSKDWDCAGVVSDDDEQEDALTRVSANGMPRGTQDWRSCGCASYLHQRDRLDES